MVVPPKHPKMIIFSRKTLVVGYHHFRKPPYTFITKPAQVTTTPRHEFRFTQSPPPNRGVETARGDVAIVTIQGDNLQVVDCLEATKIRYLDVPGS